MMITFAKTAGFASLMLGLASPLVVTPEHEPSHMFLNAEELAANSGIDHLTIGPSTTPNSSFNQQFIDIAGGIVPDYETEFSQFAGATQPFPGER